MGVDHSEISHPYPQSLQLKLYQSFIFSVPILFTIILFLLFFVFYLKRRSSIPSFPQQVTTRSFNQATSLLSLPFDMALKKELEEGLPIVIFDEEKANSRGTQCCVCLSDFEMEGQLHQIPPCNHIFHIDCIHHWLIANATCPLCRVPVLPLTKDPLEKFGVVQEAIEVVVQPSGSIHEGSSASGEPCSSNPRIPREPSEPAPVS